MYCTVKKSVFSGSLYIPPSKSETMRAIIFAAMADGVSKVSNFLYSPDTFSMIEAVKEFGVKIEQNGSTLNITGVSRKLKAPKRMIDVGNSGLAFRFVLALAALVEEEVLITGDESIRTRRPINSLLDVYRKSGMTVRGFSSNDGKFISIKGTLQPGEMKVDGQDSQLVSSLLFTTSFLEGNSLIKVKDAGEKPWIDLTLDFFSRYGKEISHKNYSSYEVKGGFSYKGFSYQIGGDYSTALFPIAAGLISNREVVIEGLKQDSLQADRHAIEIFQEMGADLSFDTKGALHVGNNQTLLGVQIDINHCIDVFPILSVVALFAKTKTEITGYEIAKKKESNRIEVMINELGKLGAKIEERDGKVTIHPSKLSGAKVSSAKDHRVALSLIVAAIRANGSTTIGGVEALLKTYPTAVYDFLSSGVDLDVSL